MPARTDIARLKITLVMPPACFQHGVNPVVMRRICVTLSIRLDRLHQVIQAAFGWTNSHLWEFSARGIGWGPKDDYDDTCDGLLDAARTTLLNVIDDVGAMTLGYLYDFSNGWDHKIKIERIFKGVPGLALPFLLDATGRRPPEDIGGPAGYGELLEAMADPGHPRHDEFTDHCDAGLDLDAFEIRHIEDALAAIAARARPAASSRPRKRQKRSAGDRP